MIKQREKMDIESYMAEFLLHIGKNKNFSNGTVGYYEFDLKEFAEFLREEFPECLDDAKNIDILVLRGYAAKLVQSKLQIGTVHRKIAVLRSFSKFLYSRAAIDVNYARHLRLPRMPKKLPTFLDFTQIDTAIDLVASDEVDNKHKLLQIRDKTIIEIFYCTGIRASELAGLNLQSVDLEQCKMLVFGKGRKERIVPFGDSARASLKAYLDNVRPQLVNDKDEVAFFLSRHGKRIRYSEIYRLVRRNLARVTDGKRSPHVLRHTFATHLLENGADIMAIKELLGHESVATTQKYSHTTIEYLRNSYRKAHPKSTK